MKAWISILALCFVLASTSGCGVQLPTDIANGSQNPPGELPAGDNGPAAGIDPNNTVSPDHVTDDPNLMVVLPPQIQTPMNLTPGA